MNWFSDLFKKKNNDASVKKTEAPVPTPAPIVITMGTPLPTGRNRNFIDISHQNDSVDLPSLKSQALVILKCTQRIDFSDNRFQSRWIGLKALGIPRGAYHFYETAYDPIQQAKFFLKNLGDIPKDEKIVLALDFEVYEGHQGISDLIKHKPNALLFLKYVKDQTGIIPWIYVNEDEIIECKFEAAFADYPLWLAKYSSQTPDDKQGPWSQWTAWQYKENGKLSGVSGNVDMDIFHL